MPDFVKKNIRDIFQSNNHSNWKVYNGHIVSVNLLRTLLTNVQSVHVQMYMYKVFCDRVNLYLKQKATVKFRFLKPLRKKELGFNYQRVKKIGIK